MTGETVICFIVRGQPAPQGSKRYLGRGIMIESSARVKPWREAVKQAALDRIGPGWQPWDCPIRLEIACYFARPKSHFGTGRNAHLLKTNAPAFPAGPPDASKLARSTEDALTEAGVWRDDARVVDLRVRKEYIDGAHGLTAPGASIMIQKRDATP